MIKFGHIELFVAKPAGSAEFYERVLGFEETIRINENLIWMQLGALEILLRQGTVSDPAARYEESANGIVLYTENISATKAELEARGLKFRGTVDSNKCWTFTDPDGNWFQLVNPNDH